MDTVTKYIFLFLIGTTLLNFSIAVTAKIKTKNKAFNELILYWTSLFFTYLAVAVLSGSPKQIALAYFFQFIPSFFMTKMLMESRNIKFNLKLYGVAQLVGSVVSAYLLLSTEVGFTISLLPVTISSTLPYWHPIVNTLITQRAEANWIEKGMAWMFISGVINHFNYAFFRLDPEAQWWGWSVSIAQYQCLSIFLPLLINHRRSVIERKNIEMALTQLSGKHTSFNSEIDELYRTLELQIAQKEELTRKLQSLNAHLEEEREVNEILIKSVSHDVANPLTVISAYTQMLASGRFAPGEFNMIFDRVLQNTKSALDMIARLRKAIMTRNKANVVTLQDVSVDQTINKLLIQFDSALNEKNIKVDYQRAQNPYLSVIAEEDALTDHIFTNIFSNCIKFSHHNSKIEIKVSETEHNVVIEFRDFGVGIASNRLEKRLLTSTQGTNGEIGSGFGVIIMGYFLRQFGASHAIHSDGENRGATVTLTLKKTLATHAIFPTETNIANISW
jgi:signal transduction histidine kinase